MAAKRVFISFNYDLNRYYKNLLLSWNTDHEFEFELYDGSLRDLFDSANGDYIKSQIKPMIQRASHVLFLIGEKCSRSKWVEWEAQTAFELGKRVAAAKVEETCATPKALASDAVSWASSFTFDAIKAAIEAAPLPASSPAAAASQAAANLPAAANAPRAR